MTTLFSSAVEPPTPAQRVKLLRTPLTLAFVRLCCCGLNGRPEHTAADAFAAWEHHRAATCALRPDPEV